MRKFWPKSLRITHHASLELNDWGNLILGAALPIYPCRMNKILTTILSKLHTELVSLYGSRLSHMILYGSHARSDAEPYSDIDVLLVLEGSVNPFQEIARTGEVVASISLEYDELISCVFVSTAQFRDSQNPLLLNIRSEGLPWPLQN